MVKFELLDIIDDDHILSPFRQGLTDKVFFFVVIFTLYLNFSV